MRFSKSLLWLLAATCALAQDYGGPAILSRGQTASNTQAPSTTVFRPYISVSGIYDTGLTALSLDTNGQAPDTAGPGVEAGFGLDGAHSWHHTTLNLNYRGDYRHYSNRSYYDGSDDTLSLGITHQSSRRLQYQVTASAGTFTRAFNFGYIVSNPFVTNLANNNIFDNRVNYFATVGRVIYLKSARLSFSASGTGYLVRRQSSSLYGMTGSSADGDVVYRYSRYGSIGLDYRFDRFDFTKAFGSTNMHTVTLQWALRLSRRWELSLEGGGSRVELQSLQLVQIDPVIAAILGTRTGVAAFYSLHYTPALGGRLTRSFQHASLQFSYHQGVMPGNGLYLTSRQQTANASFSYTGIRRWNFGIHADRDTMSSIGTGPLGHYSTNLAGIGFTRSIGRHDLHIVGGFDVRKLDITVGHFNRLQYRTSLGFAYSPGDLPLSLW